MDFLKGFDGTSRIPRDVQVQALTWLNEGWAGHKIHVLSSPVGSGKSSIARAVQRQTDGIIIVPENILMRQYMDTFPGVNHLMGKAHYTCTSGLSCKDWIDALEQKPCDECPYMECKTRATAGEPTFYNPMSLYYTAFSEEVGRPQTIIVDEAHRLAEMLLLLCGRSLSFKLYGFPDTAINELHMVEWLRETVRKLRKNIDIYTKHIALESNRKARQKIVNKVSSMTDDMEAMNLTRRGLEEDPQNYSIWVEKKAYDKYLNIRPIRPPRFIVNRLLGANRIVLMSGTISKTDVEDLFPDQAYRFLDLPSPIPLSGRPVFVRPVTFRMNFETPPSAIAAEIEKVILRNPGLNTIVHVTYDMGQKLAPYFTIPVLINTKESKTDILAKFKAEGGILIAAGMSDGIDLPGDFCRLNIIPKLIFANIKDPTVMKRKAMVDGQEWYAVKTLMKVVQQTGRSTRGETDYSKTYILDPMFGDLMRRYGNKLPKSFTESLIWSLEC